MDLTVKTVHLNAYVKMAPCVTTLMDIVRVSLVGMEQIAKNPAQIRGGMNAKINFLVWPIILKDWIT